MEKKNEIDNGIILLEKIIHEVREQIKANRKGQYVFCSHDMNSVMYVNLENGKLEVEDVTIRRTPLWTYKPSLYDNKISELAELYGVILMPIPVKNYLTHYLDRLNEALNAYRTIKSII